MPVLRRLLLPAALVAVALLAGGCLVQSVDVRQAVGGPAEIEVQMCQQDDYDAGPDDITLECDPTSTDPNPVPSNLKTGGWQLFVGLLVPAAAAPRDAVLSGGLTGPLTFSQPLSDRFTELSAPPAGRKWVGFLTGAMADGTSNTARLLARFDLPAGSGGQAFPYEVRVSGRDAGQVGQPIPPLANLSIPAIAGTALSGVLALRDVTLASAAPGPVDARRGQTVSVPFRADYAGTIPSGLLPLAATTLVPGATAAPNAGTLSFPATGTQPVSANVAVPPSAPPGTYPVTLRLPLADGGERTATGSVRVLPDPPAPPAPPAPGGGSAGGGTTATVPSQSPPVPTAPAITAAQLRAALAVVAFRTTKRSTVLRDGLRFEQTFLTPGTVVWELRRRTGSARAAQSGGARLARLTRTITSAGKQTVTLRLTRAGKRAARRGRRAPATLTTSFTPAGRGTITTSKAVTLRP